MKTSDGLVILELGDVHLGHPNTETEMVVRNIRTLIPDNSKTAEVDLIIIAGDLWHTLLSFSDDSVYIGQMLIGYLLQLCIKYDIVLRILEGTPSHDWRQSREFITQNEKLEKKADVRFITDLSIEHVEKLGISILYVPDEWRSTCSETWQDILVLMEQQRIEKVDFAVVHGTFPHQMPSYLHDILDMHDPHKFMSIVRKYIFAAHIHIHAMWERIIGAGSTDRLCHGEEEPKGIIRVTIKNGCDDIIEFIENKNAKKYVTIDCHELDTDAVLKVVKEKIDELPNGSFVRIRANKLDQAVGAYHAFMDLYPQFQWSLSVDDRSEKPSVLELEDRRREIQTVHLSRENLSTLLLNRIREKRPEMVTHCERLLGGIIE